MTPDIFRLTAEGALRYALDRLATGAPLRPDACRAMLGLCDAIRKHLIARLDAHEAAHREAWRKGRVLP